MRAFFVLMSLANVALAAASGFFVARAPFVFDTGGAGVTDVETVVPFALVVSYPVFCLIAAALPLVLIGRGKFRAAFIISVLPGLIAAAVWMTIRL